MGKAGTASQVRKVDVDEVAAGPVHPLTVVELEVLKWIADGKRNHEIADLMTGRTTALMVQNHVNHIMDKVGASSRAAAVAWGLRRKVIA